MRLLIAIVLPLLLASPAVAESKGAATHQCFSSAAWRGWSALPDQSALYLRVRGNDIYRVELAAGTRVHRYGGEFLVNQIHGSDWICSALDLNLAISDQNGISRSLIATDLRRLTPEEAAAIPREDMPS